MYLFETTKDHLALARAEIANLLLPPVEEEGNLFLANVHEPKFISRLAYTSVAYTVLARCASFQLKETLATIPWDTLCHPSYGVRSKTVLVNEKEVARHIWSTLNDPVVNLHHPETWIVFFAFKGDILICKHVWNNPKNFLQRRAHLRPAPHPSSLDPRLARACINISGLKRGVLLDPFCGSGGILIEAGKMRLRTGGFDLDELMLKRARKNLDHYGVTNTVLTQCDAIDAKNYDFHIDAILTDVPYGKASSLHARTKDELYEKFLATIATVKCLRFCILFPSDFGTEKIEQYFRIIETFSFPLHKSLSKTIYLLEKIERVEKKRIK